MKMPPVGVVVVNWNSFVELQRCLAVLAAVRGQIRRTVVIDNCSRCAPDDLPYPRPDNTEYVRLDSNTGFARRNNLAFPYLEDRGWIALVNPDAYVDEGRAGEGASMSQPRCGPINNRHVCACEEGNPSKQPRPPLTDFS